MSKLYWYLVLVKADLICGTIKFYGKFYQPKRRYIEWNSSGLNYSWRLHHITSSSADICSLNTVNIFNLRPSALSHIFYYYSNWCLCFIALCPFVLSSNFHDLVIGGIFYSQSQCRGITNTQKLSSDIKSCLQSKLELCACFINSR